MLNHKSNDLKTNSRGFSRQSNRRAARLACCAAATIAATILGHGHSALAANDINWSGAPGTPLSFGDGGNWTGGVVPGSGDNGVITNGGIATVGAAVTGSVTDIRLGDLPSTFGGLLVNGGSLSASGNILIGNDTTGTGTFSITSGTLNVGSGLNGEIDIGNDGVGTSSISGGFINTRFVYLGKSTHGRGVGTQTGGTLAVSRNFVMDELKPADTSAPQATSTYTMSGGTITVGSEMYIGAHGPAVFALSSNGFVSVAGTVHVGASGGFSDPPGGTGTINMSGGTINVTGANAHFVIADHGDGTFNFSAGAITTNFYNVGQNFEPGFTTTGVVNQTGGSATANYAWVVGEASRSANLYDLSGGTVTVIGVDESLPGDLNIGGSPGGVGTLKVRGTGVATIANSANIGNGSLSNGTLIVSDNGSFSLGNNGLGTSALIIGNFGMGTLQVTGGNLSTDFITIGQNAASTGNASQTGGTVTVRANLSIGEASNNANIYNISGGTLSTSGLYVGTGGKGTLQISGTARVSASTAFETAQSGSATISVGGGSLTAPSFVNRGFYTQSGGSASLGAITGTGSIVSSGGSLTSSSIAQGTLQISGTGVVTVSPNGSSAGLSVVNSLSITGTGKLDLNDNDMVVDYTTPATPPDVRTLLAAGRITSSKAATSPNPGEQGKTAIGYGEASVVLGASGGTFDGLAVDGSATLLKYTYQGDVNLDGKVDIVDLGKLAGKWQQSGVWTDGDMNYDATINIVDLGLLAGNWQKGVSSPLGQADFSTALAALGLPNLSVPEPGALAVSMLSLTGLLGRRRARNTVTKQR